MRLAAIDIGTVTCRLLIGEVENDTIVSEIARECEITNLGIGVDKTGLLKPDAIERVAHQIKLYADRIDQASEGIRMPVFALATSASRDAKNAQDLIDALARSGISLTVISGSREASLSFEGASLDFPGEPLMVVDIGGGSTEIIVGKGGESPQFAHSFNVGCRRVTERFLFSDPPTKKECSMAQSWIHEIFEPIFNQAHATFSSGFKRIVAVAGTATTVVSVSQHMAVYDSSKVHGSVVDLQTLKDVYHKLAALPLAQRQEVVGLEPKRASVIVAGLLILLEVLTLAGIDEFTISESDILHGILLEGFAGNL